VANSVRRDGPLFSGVMVARDLLMCFL